MIKNFEKLATTPLRSLALEIVESGLEAINTRKAVSSTVILEGDLLKIKDRRFDLKEFGKISAVGFGKASCDAMLELDTILSKRISKGIAIDIRSSFCENPNIKIYEGSHPKPTPHNVTATKEIIEMAKDISEKDLIICVVSGGGSSLLCSSENECDLSNLVYDEFLKAGGSINELNVLRKHISTLKGGGLAKIFYPATVVSLIFSDIPGGKVSDVASGPTFLDPTTVNDAKAVVEKYNFKFPPTFEFLETPKEEKYFQKVSNILLVSNNCAIEAMKLKAESLGFSVEIYSQTILDKVYAVAEKLSKGVIAKHVRLGGGEPVITAYKGVFGKGGRNTQLALESSQFVKEDQAFISIASDGIDNSDCAGAIVDGKTLVRIAGKFNYKEQVEKLNAYPVFEELSDLIFTGPTGANVADLMLSIRY